MTGGGDIEEESKKTGIPVRFLKKSDQFQDVLVYPDNWEAVAVFSDLLTQWRVGPGGLVGIDYGTIPVVFRIRRVSRQNQSDIFDGIRIMEIAALNAVRENRDGS